jgi:hypothetical protein
MAVKLNLEADRWLDFFKFLPILNADLTTATAINMQVRVTPDAEGTALADLSLDVDPGAGGTGLWVEDYTLSTVQEHIDAGRLGSVPTGYAATDSVGVSRLGIRIAEAVLAAMPFNTPRGNKVYLAWDLLITPFGGVEGKYVEGQFVLIPGVTQ